MRDYAVRAGPGCGELAQFGTVAGESQPTTRMPRCRRPPLPASIPPLQRKPAAPTSRRWPIALGEGAAAVVHVRTDVLDLDISLQGGTFTRADLLRYPKVKGGRRPRAAHESDGPDSLYLLQSGLHGPTRRRATDPSRAIPERAPGLPARQRAELRVPLTWTDGRRHGHEDLRLPPGSNTASTSSTTSTTRPAPWEAAPYAQIVRNDPPTKRSMFNVESYAFHGPAFYDGTKYRKLNITDEDDRRLDVEATNGWIARLQHHFVGAVVPPSDATYRFTLER